MRIDMKTLELTETRTAVACCVPLTASTLTDAEADATAALFRALGDPARVRIVNMLANSAEPVCACDVIPAIGLAQPTVSHHLKKLVEVGLVEREQRGKWAYFSLNPEATAQLAGLLDLEGGS